METIKNYVWEMIGIIATGLASVIATYLAALVRNLAQKAKFQLDQKKIETVVFTVVKAVAQTTVKTARKTKSWEPETAQKAFMEAFAAVRRELDSQNIQVSDELVKRKIEAAVRDVKNYFQA